MTDLFGFTRNVVNNRYALLTPSGFVPSYLPGWEKAVCNVLISPAMGARFCQLLITLERDCRGAGNTGFPNLVDDDWLWGGNIDQIYATIQHGVRNADDNSRQSLMPRFGADAILTGPQVAAVTDYVLSLSGHGKATPEGAKIWQEQCVACHQADGKGNQELGAPNLTDGIWLYGGDRDSIYRSIFYARNGSMPAWGERLDEATIKMLTLYVHALGGGK